MSTFGTRTENAKRNIAGGMVNRAVSLVLPFFIQTAMVYCLGDLYWGLNSLFTSILQVLCLAELGIGSAMVFSMYEPMAKGDRSAVCALLRLYRDLYHTIGLVILLAGLAAAPFVPKLIRGEVPDNVNLYVLYLIQLSDTVIGYFMYGYRSSLLAASQRSDVSSRIQTAVSLGSGILKIAVLLLLKSYYLFCLIMPVMTVVSNLMTKWATDRMFPEYRCEGNISPEKKKDIRKRVAGLFLYKACNVFRSSFDSIIISAFLGLYELGVYRRYYMVMNGVMGFLMVIPNAITAGVGNSIVQETREKNYRDFCKFQFLFMWLSGWATVCLYCLYQPFMRIWVGEARMFDQSVMTVFCVYFFVEMMGNICFQYRQAAGLWWEDRFRPVVESVVNLTLNVVLVKNLGVTGVLLSTILCLVFINAGWGSRILYKHYFTAEKQRFYLIRLGIYGIMTCAACVITDWCCGWVPWEGMVGLLIKMCICMIVPNGCFFILSFWMPERKSAVDFVKNKVLRI